MIPSTYLYTAEQTRAIDHAAIERGGMSGHSLMQRAGEAAFSLIRSRWPHMKRMHVLCGTGNNGGDGWVVARLSRDAGLDVQVELVGDDSRIHGAARQAMYDYLHAGGDFHRLDGNRQCEPGGACVVVDALLGTGVTGALRPEHRRVIERINHSQLPVFAIDCPSGLNPDTGMPQPCAVRATCTLTFLGRNRGLYTGEAADYTGDLHFDDLGVPPSLLTAVPADAELLDWQRERLQIPRRTASSHKGRHGHVLIIGGQEGFSGAAILAAEAALRAGAGLVSLASQATTVTAALVRHPEIMAQTVHDSRDLRPLLARADSVVIGPGLGQGPWAQQLLGAVCDAAKPTVYDADALNLMASSGLAFKPADTAIVTPHPGEAARLLGVATSMVSADRFHAARAVAERVGCTTVLKGRGTLVAVPGDDRPIAVCPYGTEGMASGGTGDALAGVCATLLAQRLSGEACARAAVCAHALAGERAALNGVIGMLAGDLIDALRAVLNGASAAEH